MYRRLVAIVSHPWALGVLACLCLAWVAGGFKIGFQTDWYQFAANTPLSWGAMFVTLLVLVDARRESRALHLKLDEMIRAIAEARNDYRGIEMAPEEVLDELAAQDLAQAIVPDHDAPAADALVSRLHETGRRTWVSTAWSTLRRWVHRFIRWCSR